MRGPRISYAASCRRSSGRYRCPSRGWPAHWRAPASRRGDRRIHQSARVMNAPVIEMHLAAVSRMRDALHAALPHETGGILIGWRDNGNVIITDALVVADDQADRTNYHRREARGAEVLNRYLSSASNALAGYVGEWHTHPEPSPPSATDLASIAAAASQTDAPVAIVVLAWDEKR